MINGYTEQEIVQGLRNLMPVEDHWSYINDVLVITAEGVAAGYVEPTDAELEAAIQNAQLEEAATEYQRLRRAAYPPIGDQLDALWKGGQAQAEMKTVIDGVKAMYPKPV